MNLIHAMVRQIEIEHRLSELYNHFYQLFHARPMVNTFWLEMSNEEAGHENLLRRLLDALDRDPLAAPDLPDVTAERFDRLEGELARCRLESKSLNFSLSKAFSMAISLESGEAEILFRTLLEWLDPRFDHALGQFIFENQEHRRRLESMRSAVLHEGEGSILYTSGAT